MIGLKDASLPPYQRVKGETSDNSLQKKENAILSEQNFGSQNHLTNVNLPFKNLASTLPPTHA